MSVVVDGEWVIVTDDAEPTDGIPVLAEVRTLEPSPPSVPLVVQAVAMAATGFVAGAATMALVRRRGGRGPARSARQRPRPAQPGLTVVGTRSFLVDVHLLAKPGG